MYVRLLLLRVFKSNDITNYNKLRRPCATVNTPALLFRNFRFVLHLDDNVIKLIQRLQSDWSKQNRTCHLLNASNILN